MAQKVVDPLLLCLHVHKVAQHMGDQIALCLSCHQIIVVVVLPANGPQRHVAKRYNQQTGDLVQTTFVQIKVQHAGLEQKQRVRKIAHQG